MEEKSIQECKNCSAEVEGEFCSFCGQRYHAHKESFGELVYEFTSDFLHFDSRFFKTILPLLFLPGKLTKSYNEGRQRSQFHPIRLYLFSSFVYFLLFFSFNKVENTFDNGNAKTAVITDSARLTAQKDSLNKIKNKEAGSSYQDELQAASIKIKKAGKKKFVVVNDETTQYSLTVDSYLDSILTKKVTPREYLEYQKSLGAKKKAGYFRRIITMKLLSMNLRGEEGKKEYFSKLIETFFHNIPKMLFFLLPVFAFLLKMLYYRHKQFYYVDHAVLSLHYFSLIFLLLVFSNYILDKIFNTGIFSTLAVIWIFLYLLIAMKKLYRQSWGKTFVKYIALGFLFLFTVLFTLFANLVVTAMMV